MFHKEKTRYIMHLLPGSFDPRILIRTLTDGNLRITNGILKKYERKQAGEKTLQLMWPSVSY